MIITHDDQPLEEPPPSYSPPSDAGNDPGPSSPFKTKPTNFLVLDHEHENVRGEFVIDPCMSIPSSMLPPLDDGDRKNLSLRSKSGSVRADVWLLGHAATLPRDKPGRTTVELTSESGSIHAQVNTLDGAAPFVLTANAAHGTVRLAIPCSFQGLLSLATRHGNVSLSDSLVQNATLLSQVGHTRRYFVGDFSVLGEDPWCGDQVEVEAVHGSIRLRYVDDVVEGLFSRLFKT